MVGDFELARSAWAKHCKRRGVRYVHPEDSVWENECLVLVNARGPVALLRRHGARFVVVSGEHRTKRVQLPAAMGTAIVDIDVRMVALVQTCWARGLHTRFCCQGNLGEEAYVAFETGWAAGAFLSCAGPAAWSKNTIALVQRSGREPTYDWRMASGIPTAVYFPCADIGRATRALASQVWRLEPVAAPANRARLLPSPKLREAVG